MSLDLKIQNLESISENLKQISSILEQYAQEEEKEKRFVLTLDTYILDAQMTIVEKRNNLQSILNQLSRSSSDDEESRQDKALLEKKLERLIEQLNQVSSYKETHRGIIQDMTTMCENISKLNDECRTINTKMQLIIDKIIELK